MNISTATKDKRDRQLRIVTVLSFIPAFALNVAVGVVTELPLPALNLIPMAFSTGLGLVLLVDKKRPKKPTADLVAAGSLLVFLIATWIYLTERSWLESNIAMLASYATMPPIVNFLIHTYLTLPTLPLLFRPRSCPNCNHTMPSILPKWHSRVALPADNTTPNNHSSHNNNNSSNDFAPATSQHPEAGKEVRQSLMRGYDEDARESSEFQTSGFNTPRQSVETLRSEVRSSGEGVGKGSLV
ncbi:hypothetical protein Q7P37_008416 [Cladosporium fusiforme]